MKFTLNTSVASNVFNQALKTCNIKSKGQPDSEFLFEKTDKQLTVTSLNDISEQCIVVPTINLSGDDGKFSVAGSAVVEFIKQISDNEISCGFNAKNNAFVMSTTDPARQTKFAFPVGDPNDFLPIVFKNKGIEFEISAANLAEALKCTAFAASSDNNLIPQTAVKVNVKGELLSTEASDFHRISIYNIAITDTDVDIYFLLRKDIAEILSNLFVDVDDNIKIVLAENHIRLIWGDTIFTAILENELKKKFAPVMKFFVGKLIGEAILSKTELQRSLKLASLVAKDSSVGIELNNDKIIVTTDEQGKGLSKDIIVTQKSS